MDWTLITDTARVVVPSGVGPTGRLERLAELACFDHLSRRELKAVAAVAHCVTADPGSVIARDSEPADQVFVIRKGRVDVVDESGVAATLGKGDMFGEFEAAVSGSYPASLEARGAVQMCVIDAPQYRRLADRIPGLAARLVRSLSLSEQSVA